MMTHDYSLVFDTESPYWHKVLEIFEKNEKYEKKIVSNRNLHHKFPRSFSKKLGEPVDNDKDNLISLSLADHFLVHYYYYLLAKKGYKQAMATAFTFMAKKCLKYITPETAEMMANDYAKAKCIAEQSISEVLKGRKLSDETRKKMSKPKTDETRKKMSKPKTDETRKKMSLAKKGKQFSDEHRQKLSEAIKAEWARRKAKKMDKLNV